MKLFLLSLVFVLYYITPTLAHPDGALNESCFDHAINHTDKIPGVDVYSHIVFRECDDPCIYLLNVTRKRNSAGVFEDLPVSIGPGDIFTYEYNTTYEIVLSSDEIGFLGFLIQARELLDTDDDLNNITFSADRDICGTWEDAGVHENIYRILSCPRNMGESVPYDNSVTQQLDDNLRGVFRVQMIWTSPIEDSQPQDIVFFYTIVQQVRRVFHVVSGPILMYPRPTTPPPTTVMPSTAVDDQTTGDGSGNTGAPGLAQGEIIGIAVGAGAALLLVVVVIVLLVVIRYCVSGGKKADDNGKKSRASVLWMTNPADDQKVQIET